MPGSFYGKKIQIIGGGSSGGVAGVVVATLVQLQGVQVLT